MTAGVVGAVAPGAASVEQAPAAGAAAAAAAARAGPLAVVEASTDRATQWGECIKGIRVRWWYITRRDI